MYGAMSGAGNSNPVAMAGGDPTLGRAAVKTAARSGRLEARWAFVGAVKASAVDPEGAIARGPVSAPPR